MPVVLLAADRVVSFVRNYFLEYDEPEDGGKPYLGFFLQTAGLGVVLAALIYLCGQLVLGAAYPDEVIAMASDPSFAPAVGSAGQVPAEVLQVQAVSICFACAAAVVFCCCLAAVGYLKLLFWRDERDLNTSGTALGVSAVLASCVAYSVAVTFLMLLAVCW